ncbi:MAG TPA: aromatic ring-hydroxylating dioxygenase subunit alpha [Acidimicrobiia bacterium]|nr:aromatic ring-hydroxylating dioxygenase subunit alpha [Acidimicrobiia bacterium]
MSAAESTSPRRSSVAFPKRWWYPACRSTELGRKPLGIRLMDTPLVIFRDQRGGVGALLDRCPHRNYPLSLGRVTSAGTLECGYHGWQFDECGNCALVPGLLDERSAAAENRRVPSHPALERDGVVWVWGEPEGTPDREPFALPRFEPGRGTGETVFRCDLDCTMHAALENALDVPHTAFLHRGIFRGADPKPITAVRRELDGGVEAQYLGEPVGMGPIRARAGSARTFDHWDRFYLPSIAQVEYAVDGWFRIVNTILHLPLSPYRTRAWFVVRYWSRLPAALIKPVVLGRGKQILGQDARALARQTERIRGLGGERYTSTDLDVLGNAIWRLMRQAERVESGVLGDETTPASGNGGTGGNGDGAEALVERTITFEV